MDKKKILLSLIGIAALVVPVALLIFFTGKVPKEPSITQSERQIEERNVQKVVSSKLPTPEPLILPSPSPASPSASPDVDFEQLPPEE